MTLKKLEEKWFEEPSPIQKEVIPILLQGDTNVIWQAQTGTGKTAAFGVPLAEKITEHSNHTQAIIMTPTRELAIQVAEEIQSFVSNKKINIATIYGGQAYNIQLRKLAKWADIVVGTPGRIIDHLGRKTLKIDHLRYLILDEADEMLNMGFIDDIKKILSYTNDDKSMLLFSATMPREIIQVAKKYMWEYKVVSVKKEQMTTTQTDQIYFEVNVRDKFEALSRIIDIEPDFFGIIFCKTKVDVDRVSSSLSDRGYDVAALHGDIEQRKRERILKKFRSKKLSALVATDVAARGIDVEDVTHVINYSLPWDPDSYIHRVGRTGRAGKKGTAITFVTPSEYKKIVFFKRITKTDIRLEKVPDIKEVILAKKNKIKADVQNILQGEKYKNQLEFTKELLDGWDPEQVIAALLTLHHEKELSKERYSSISEVSIDKTGKSRLFIALGRTKGYDARKLVDYVADRANVKPNSIQEVRVMDDFSFITVPFEEAEMILHMFEKTRKSWERSLVSKAKERWSNRGRSSRGWYNRGWRSSYSRNSSNSRSGGYSKSSWYSHSWDRRSGSRSWYHRER